MREKEPLIPPAAPPAPRRGLLAGRPLRHWLVLALLVGALLALGHYDGQVRSVLTHLFTASTPAPGAPVHAAAGGATLTTRNLPAMVVYGLLYIGLSILTLHFALANRRQTRLVVLAYGATLGLIAVLLVAGRLPGLGTTLTPVARELIDGGGVGGGLLSPLPVLLLIAVFRLAPRS